MKKLLRIFLCITAINGMAQVSFKKGHIIDSTGLRIECLIRDLDWKNNPDQISYKLDEQGQVAEAAITRLREFEIYGASKYVVRPVQIDRSSESVKDLSQTRNPEFRDEVLALKVLLEGKANLYQYEDGSLIRFFYSTDEIPLSQLISKRFRLESGVVGENNEFKQQIWNTLKCETIPLKRVESLVYETKSLTRFFEDYSACHNSAATNFSTSGQGESFGFFFRPGITYSSLYIQNNITGTREEFDQSIGYRIGFEAEWILPSNHAKWSFVVEPSFSSYSFSTFFNSIATEATVDYKVIDFPVGIRYYFLLKEFSRFYANALYVIPLDLDSKLSLGSGSDLELGSVGNFAVGLGVRHHVKWTGELRYSFGRELLNPYPFRKSSLNNISIIVGIKLF